MAAGSSLTFSLFGRDVSASRALGRVGNHADTTGRQLSGLGRTAGATFSGLGKVAAIAAGAFAGFAAFDLLKGTVAAASDLNETLNKSNVIFGVNAAAMEQWASGAATSFGLSKAAALESAAGFGNMFQQLGFAGATATDMSKAVVALSADLGSFNNLPTASVTDMISGAFRGEYDSLQRLIPNINAARVEKEAMAATGKKAAKELTAQEKATAVLAIVTRDGASALGDFVETSSGLANSSKIASAQFEDLQSKVGQLLLPVMGKLTAAASAFIGQLSDHLVPALTTAGGFFTGTLIPILQEVGSRFMDGLRPAVEAVSRAFTNFGRFIADNQGTIAAVGQTIGEVAATISGVLGSAISGIVTALEAVFGWLFRNEDVLLAVGVAAGIVAAAFVVWKTVQLASAAVTGVVTAAQWLLNAALTANPIGIVVVAVAALVAALVVLYNRSETVRTIIQAVWAGIQAAVGFVVTWFQTSVLPALTKAWEVISAGAGALWAAVSWYFGAVWKYVSWVVTAVWTVISTVWGFIGPWVTAYFGAVWIVISAVFSAVWNVISGVVKAVWAVISTVWGFIQPFIAEHFGRVWATVQIVWGLVKSYIAAAIAVVKGVISSVKGPIDAIIGWFQNMWAGIREIVGKVTGFIGGIKDKILDVFKGAASWLWETGENIVMGLINGIKNMAGAVKDAILNLLPGPLKSFASSLGISSPSKVFAAFGRAIPQGLAAGITGGAGDVARSMDRLMSVAQPPAMSARPGVGGGGASITNHIAISTLDPVAAAQHVRRVLLEDKRTRGVELGIG